MTAGSIALGRYDCGEGLGFGDVVWPCDVVLNIWHLNEEQERAWGLIYGAVLV